MRYRFLYVGADLCWTSPSARHQHHTARPWILASLSCSVPVYSPSFCWVLNSIYPQRVGSGWVDQGAWFCTEVVYPSVQRRSPIRAWCRVTWNSVLEELRVRRLAVIQEEICCRAFCKWLMLEWKSDDETEYPAKAKPGGINRHTSLYPYTSLYPWSRSVVLVSGWWTSSTEISADVQEAVAHYRRVNDDMLYKSTSM